MAARVFDSKARNPRRSEEFRLSEFAPGSPIGVRMSPVGTFRRISAMHNFWSYRRCSGHAASPSGRRVAVIAATSTPANRVAKEATTTIPIVFTTNSDPVELGLVASLSRPGGNVTGATTLNVEVGPKRMELLHEIVPPGALIIVLFNPKNPNVETQLRNQQAASHPVGHRVLALTAST
jgi:putative ABC transport system substrate-binding protein